MGEGKRLANGGGVLGNLYSYPTEFGFSRGDLCTIDPIERNTRKKFFSVDTSSTDAVLVTVLLSYDRILCATTSYCNSSYNMYLAIQRYQDSEATAVDTGLSLVPIAAYLVPNGKVHLYTVSTDGKIMYVYEVDVSGESPVLGNIILQFESSNSSYLYFQTRQRFSQICKVGNNRYILFTLMGTQSHSYMSSYVDAMQCTPIYDDGDTIRKGTPIWQSITFSNYDKPNFACCNYADSVGIIILIRYSSSETLPPTFLKYVFENDENPSLTVTELTNNSLPNLSANNTYCNNTYLFKLSDGSFGLFTIDATFRSRVAHFTIEGGSVSIIGAITSDGISASSGTASVFGQHIHTVDCAASDSGSSLTGRLYINVINMTDEPTVIESTSIASSGNESTSAPLSVVETVATIYRSERNRSNSNISITKLKELATVEKSNEAAYANKKALANTYGIVKIQE